MRRSSKIARAVRLALVLSTAGFGGIQHPAVAQDESDATEVLITGSRIKQREPEGYAPLVTLDAEQLAARGYNTVQEALDHLPQNAGGGFDQQDGFGFTASASAIDLRGFGVGRSLVLIDGRRAPLFPLASEGTDNFVDLSSIPLAAIERIEVLPGGASAVYGSDAVSGVINVVLKKRARNELDVRRSATADGGGAQTRVQLAAGHENLGGNTVSLFAEYFEQDRILFTDRSYSRSDVLGGMGGPGPGAFSGYGDRGTFFDDGGTPDDFEDDGATSAPFCSTSGGSPGVVNGICRYNRAQYRQLMPQMEHASFTARLQRPLTETLDAFARATYFRSSVVTQLEPLGADTTLIPADNPNNPVGLAGTWQRRMVEFGPRLIDTDNDLYGIVAGLQGRFGGGYEWELGAQYAEQRVVSRGRGYFLIDRFDAALTTGLDLDGDGVREAPISLFDPIPQSVADALWFEPRTDGRSTIRSLDYQLTGDLFSLPHGAARFAVAAEHARQRFEDRRDAEVLAGNVEGLGGTSGAGDRKYSALGLEVELPVLEDLSVHFAGRYDHYDDASAVGGAFSPRVALQLRAGEKMTLRASAGRSFRAPDMQRMFAGATIGFVDVIDTPQCVAEGGSGRGDESVASCVTPLQALPINILANRDLHEEKGDHFGFGMRFEPLPGLAVTTDFWYLALEGAVATLNPQLILDAHAATGAHAQLIERDPAECDALANPGCLSRLDTEARNLAIHRSRGVDFAVEYRLPERELGSFRLTVAGTYVDRLEARESAAEALVSILADGTLGETPRLRGQVGVDWERGAWGGSLFVNHIGDFTPEDSTSVDEVASYSTVNLSGSYALPWSASVQLGVNNLFNRKPPLDLSEGNSAQPFYNQHFHEPFGSTWWLRYVQRFER